MKQLTREQVVNEFNTKAGVYDQEEKVEIIRTQWGNVVEEYRELQEEIFMHSDDATAEKNASLLKELVDCQYVLSGLVDAFGFTDVFQEAFNRVHKNNMGKIEDSVVKDATGKIMKPAGYEPVKLEDLFE